MLNELRQKLRPHWHRVRPYAPFVAFATGFAFDMFTLGTKVDPIDLYLVSLYATMALFGLILRELTLPSWAVRGANLLLQFSLGGSLSALVVLYFRSTGQLLSFLFVATIFTVAVVNEFMHRDEPPHREWVLALWVVSAAMLANFVIPHWVGSISPFYFYASTAATVSIAVALKLLFRFSWRSLRFALPSAGLLVLLWILGFIPPVPLVYKNNLVCTDFRKAEYSCRVDEPDFWTRIGIGNPTVTVDKDAVYVLTAVFAPGKVDVTVKHHWYRRNDKGRWEQTDDMQFRMTGGRKDGWRFWSRKRNPRPGWWKVETALEGGAVLGYEKFEVVTGSAKKRREAL